MAHDKRSLINLALGHLGEPPVSAEQLAADPPEPNVEKALVQYDQAADTAQASAPWLCCLKWATLDVEDTVEAEPDTVSAYLLPDDALHVWTVDLPEDAVWRQAVEVDGEAVRKVVRTDQTGALTLAYTRRTPIAGWDPLLADAFGYQLAARLAGPIKGDIRLGATMQQLADVAYTRARGGEAGRSKGALLHGGGPVAQGRALGASV